MPGLNNKEFASYAKGYLFFGLQTKLSSKQVKQPPVVSHRLHGDEAKKRWSETRSLTKTPPEMHQH